MRKLVCIVLAVLAGLVFSLSACAGQVIRAGDVSVLVSERTGSGMDALAAGPLKVIGGCLGLGDAVVVWPHGTDVVKEDPLTIEVPDYGTFALGEQVQVGGGFVLEHSSDKVEPGPVEIAGVTVPAACAEHDIFLAH